MGSQAGKEKYILRAHKEKKNTVDIIPGNKKVGIAPAIVQMQPSVLIAR